MDQIVIKDLEVHFCVGVTAAERAKPQRLLLTVEMDRSCAAAARSDDLEDSINYYAVAQRLLSLGKGRSWNFIEAVGGAAAGVVLREFQPQPGSGEVKKFVLTEAGHVSVRITRPE